MVDVADDEYNWFQQQWVDKIDSAKYPIKLIDDALAQCKSVCVYPWNHPRQNMRWLWDYLLSRRAELCGNIAS
jgi:hypothetical protein